MVDARDNGVSGHRMIAKLLSRQGSGDRAEEMKSFYREKLAGDGWTVEDAKETLRARKSGRELVARFESKDPVRGTHAVIEIRAPRS